MSRVVQVGGVLLVLIALGFAYSAGAAAKRQHVRDSTLMDDQHQIDSLAVVRATRAATATAAVQHDSVVTVRTKVLHDTVRIVDASHVTIRTERGMDTVAVIPPEVGRRITQDSLALAHKDTTIDALRLLVSADSVERHALMKKIVDLSVPPPQPPLAERLAVAVVRHPVVATVVVVVTVEGVRMLLHGMKP